MVKKSFVAIEKAPPSAIEESVGKCLDSIKWKSVVKGGAKVGIKVNVGWDRFVAGSTTSPRVVKGLIMKLKEKTSDISIVENNSIAHDATRGFEITGFNDLAKQMDVKLINLVSDSYKKFKIDLGESFGKVQLEIANSLFDYDVFITAPVLKTHGLTKFTCSIKNQWGCIRKTRFLFHLRVNTLLAELNSIIPPDISVCDGTIIMEGQAPKLGNPRRLDLVMASTDFVALDCVGANILGLDPNHIEHIQECAKKNLGVADFNHISVNKNLDKLRIRSQPAGGLSYGDMPRSVSKFILHHEKIKQVAFNSPLFEVFRRMYARYNDLWYFTVGKKKTQKILENYDYFKGIK